MFASWAGPAESAVGQVVAHMDSLLQMARQRPVCKPVESVEIERGGRGGRRYSRADPLPGTHANLTEPAEGNDYVECEQGK